MVSVSQKGWKKSLKIQKGVNRIRITKDRQHNDRKKKENQNIYEGYWIDNIANHFLFEGNVPNIVRVMASAGCQYCNDKNNMTCSEWYCPEGKLSYVFCCCCNYLESLDFVFMFITNFEYNQYMRSDTVQSEK
jgi:hypothetical protein